MPLINIDEINIDSIYHSLAIHEINICLLTSITRLEFSRRDWSGMSVHDIILTILALPYPPNIQVEP